jgi:hypothetical protein
MNRGTKIPNTEARKGTKMGMLKIRLSMTASGMLALAPPITRAMTAPRLISFPNGSVYLNAGDRVISGTGIF